ncbi:hypothetical protein [Desertivirga brevis]|nr:hypothetical protein [Pedobacter sp. SYSU D00873]
MNWKKAFYILLGIIGVVLLMTKVGNSNSADVFDKYSLFSTHPKVK